MFRIARAAALGLLASQTLWLGACHEEKRRPRARAHEPDPRGDAPTSAAPSAPPSSSPHASSSLGATPGRQTAEAGLSVTLDAKALAVDHVLVKRRPDGKLQLYLGKGGGTCAMLLDNLFSGSFEHVLVDLLGRLASDGAESLAVGDIHHHGPQTPDAGASAKLLGAFGEKGQRVAIELDLAAKSAGVSIKGTASAESCGDEVRSAGPGVPTPPLAASGTLTVAGKKLALRGALVRRDGYELTDFPRDCTTAWFIGARLALKGSSFTLDGQRFAEAVTGEAKGLTIKRGAGAPRKQEGVEVVTLELSGAGRVGAFEVSLGGTLEALVCPP